MDQVEAQGRRPNLLSDLGLTVTAVGDELHGTGEVIPAMWVPGSTSLRISILAAWTDTVLGLLAVRAIAPRVPVTLELDVDLVEEIRDVDTVYFVGRSLKVGKSVLVTSIEFHTREGDSLGVGHSLFMAAPDPGISMPAGNWAIDRFAARRGSLTEPFADAAGCTRPETGSAMLPCASHLLNSSKTLNGGLLGLVVEEAALSADPNGRPLVSMQLHYLKPVRGGPAIATAIVRRCLGEVEVRDASTGALAIVATTRSLTGGETEEREVRQPGEPLDEVTPVSI